MSNKITKKAAHGPVQPQANPYNTFDWAGQLPPFDPKKYKQLLEQSSRSYNDPLRSFDRFLQSSDSISQRIREQKSNTRSGTAKKDGFYHKYVVPVLNTAAQILPTATIAYTIAGHRKIKELQRNMSQSDKLLDNRRFWQKELETATQNKDDFTRNLAARELRNINRAIESNIERGIQLSSDTVAMGNLAGTSARNMLGVGPMLELYNTFASDRNRIRGYQDSDTHRSLAGASPEIQQAAGNAVAAKPVSNLSNLLLYSYIGGPLLGKAFRAAPYIGKAPNAIQLASRPWWLPTAQTAQKVGLVTFAGQTARAAVHNGFAAQQRKNGQPSYTLPILAMIPGPPIANSPTFSTQNGPEQIRITNALYATNAARSGAPIPKYPTVHSPYIGTRDVLSAGFGNMAVNFIPGLHTLDTISNYMQYVPYAAPQAYAKYMPYFRGAYDPSNVFTRSAAGPDSLDSGQQQRNQLAAQNLFKDAHKYMYWPARPVINTALYKTLQQNDDLAGSYADYVRAAAAAGESIKSLPPPSAHWRSGAEVPELQQEQAHSVFGTYAYTLDTPNAFAGIELAQNSKQAAAIRAGYMGQLKQYINMLPDENIAELALQYQLARYHESDQPDVNRLLISPVLSTLGLPKARLKNIILIYMRKMAPPQQGYYY